MYGAAYDVRRGAQRVRYTSGFRRGYPNVGGKERFTLKQVATVYNQPEPPSSNAAFVPNYYGVSAAVPVSDDARDIAGASYFYGNMTTAPYLELAESLRAADCNDFETTLLRRWKYVRCVGARHTYREVPAASIITGASYHAAITNPINAPGGVTSYVPMDRPTPLSRGPELWIQDSFAAGVAEIDDVDSAVRNTPSDLNRIKSYFVGQGFFAKRGGKKFVISERFGTQTIVHSVGYDHEIPNPGLKGCDITAGMPVVRGAMPWISLDDLVSPGNTAALGRAVFGLRRYLFIWPGNLVIGIRADFPPQADPTAIGATGLIVYTQPRLYTLAVELFFEYAGPRLPPLYPGLASDPRETIPLGYPTVYTAWGPLVPEDAPCTLPPGSEEDVEGPPADAPMGLSAVSAPAQDGAQPPPPPPPTPPRPSRRLRRPRGLIPPPSMESGTPRKRSHSVLSVAAPQHTAPGSTCLPCSGGLKRAKAVVVVG